MLVDGKQKIAHLIARFVCLPAFVHFTIVFCVSWDCMKATYKQERWQVRTHFKRPCFAGARVTNSVAAFRGSGTNEGICGYVSPFGIPWDLCGLLFPWPWSKGIINQELMYFSHTAILTKAQKLKRGGSIKRVARKFLEFSRCRRARQRQKNVQKKCAARAKLHFC